MGKFKKGPNKGLSDSRKKSAPQKVLNPFEVHVNKQKFQVLGRKLKNDRGLPGVARAKALKKRKATLLQEFKLKDKSNKFVDRRIGERNSAMTADDKMTARFTAERMRAQNRKAMFNLADEEVLTHRGQTLNEIEKFDDPRSDDDDDNEEDNPFKAKGNLDADFVGDAHFGGGLLSRSHEDGAKSRKDLIDQLISESKKRKAEQQKLREQTLDLTEKLDSEWKDLLPIMTASNKVSEVKKPKLDSFDVIMRELKFEARGKPSDRLKSVDEIAQEEKTKLEELEAERLRRMQGITESAAESASKHRSADDLDDGFAMDTDDDEEEEEEGQDNSKPDSDKEDNAGEDKNSSDNESNDEDAGENKYDSNKSSDVDDDEDDDDDNDGSSDDSDDDNIDDLRYDSSDEDNIPAEDAGEQMNTCGDLRKEKETHTSTNSMASPLTSDKKVESIREDLRKRKELMDAARKELPYTFEVPATFEELQIVLAGRSPEYQGVIVERMIKCTHPSLASGNKEKLAHLFTLLMQHLHDASSVDEEDNVCWAVLDRFAPSLFDITQWCPDETAQCIRHILQEKQQEYRSNKKKFPGVETLLFFKLISLLFPTSDFRHPVVTPAMVFMGQILSSCRIESRQDIARGLLLVSLFLEYTTLSKRFSPESINFLRNVLYLASKFPTQQKTATVAKLSQVRPLPPVKALPGKQLSLQPKDISPRKVKVNDRLQAIDLISKYPIDDDFCITSVSTSSKILSSFVTHLMPLPACRHIFNPFPPLLESLIEEPWLPAEVKDELKNVLSIIQSLKGTELKYLMSAPKRPKPLKLYEPNIQQVYTDGKQRRPISKEKQEREKLIHRYKREKKGALREIRKDRDFLAKIRIKQQLKSDAERRAKVKEIYGDASMQQGEMRKLARTKKK